MRRADFDWNSVTGRRAGAAAAVRRRSGEGGRSVAGWERPGRSRGPRDRLDHDGGVVDFRRRSHPNDVRACRRRRPGRRLAGGEAGARPVVVRFPMLLRFRGRMGAVPVLGMRIAGRFLRDLRGRGRAVVRAHPAHERSAARRREDGQYQAGGRPAPERFSNAGITNRAHRRQDTIDTSQAVPPPVARTRALASSADGRPSSPPTRSIR